MEEMNQKFGLIMYSININCKALGLLNSLKLEDLKDYANIYFDRKYEKSLFRGDD